MRGVVTVHERLHEVSITADAQAARAFGVALRALLAAPIDTVVPMTPAEWTALVARGKHRDNHTSGRIIAAGRRSPSNWEMRL